MTQHQGHLQSATTHAANIDYLKLFGGRQTYPGFKHDAHLFARKEFTLLPSEVSDVEGIKGLRETARRQDPTGEKHYRILSFRVTAKESEGSKPNVTDVYFLADHQAYLRYSAFFHTKAEHHNVQIRKAVKLEKLPEVPLK